MSLINILNAGDRAIVMVDTGLGHPNPDGEFSECAKALVLPHLDMIVAGRGCYYFQTRLWQALHNQTDFDYLKTAIGEICNDLWRAVAPTVTQHAESEKIEVVLIGWSRELARFEIAAAIQADPTEGFLWKLCGDRYIAPYYADLETNWAPQSERELAALAVAQIAHMRQRWPNRIMGGGRLLRYDLRPGRVAVDTIHAFDAQIRERAS